MRRQLDELRQVRKEAAVIAMVVCCGVPGLFCARLPMVKLNKFVCNFRFRLPESVKKIK